MKRFLVIGAFDRFNYGDLLFPYMVELSLLRRISEIEFVFFGIKKSNLERFGAKKTLSIRDFYKYCNNSDKQTWVVIAGGEVLPISWTLLFSFLSPIYRTMSKFRYFLNIEPIIMSFYNAKSELPLLILKKNFKSVSGVIYNSIGAIGVDNEAFSKYSSLSQVADSDFFSVRDRISYNNFSNFPRTKLSPDSVTLLSTFYSLNKVEENVSKNVKSFVHKEKNNYIFFQINKEIFIKDEIDILNNLALIYKKYGFTICLCPIGKASGHRDQYGLKKIDQKIQYSHVYFPNVNIWDIIYLIGNSSCYIGSSLHGVITSISYSVPYLGIQIGKIESYLNTWGDPLVNFILNISDLSEKLDLVLKTEKSVYVERRDIQIKLVEENFNDMCKIIENNKDL